MRCSERRRPIPVAIGAPRGRRCGAWVVESPLWAMPECSIRLSAAAQIRPLNVSCCRYLTLTVFRDKCPVYILKPSSNGGRPEWRSLTCREVSASDCTHWRRTAPGDPSATSSALNSSPRSGRSVLPGPVNIPILEAIRSEGLEPARPSVNTDSVDVPNNGSTLTCRTTSV